MKTYDITVIRTPYSSRAIQVEAATREEANQLALEVAGDYEFSEHDADYQIGD